MHGHEKSMGKSVGKVGSSCSAPKDASKEWVYPDPGTGTVSTYWAKSIIADDLKYAEAETMNLPLTESSLRALVLQDMHEAPYEYRGLVWSKRPVGWYAERLGLSDRHTSRLMDKICARRLVIKLDEKKNTLIRVGGNSRLCADDLARIMVAIWRQTTGRKHSAEEYGMLLGLADDWPYPYAPDLFKNTLDNWSVFMVGVKHYINVAKVAGDFFESNPAKYHDRYLRYPSIKVMRRFWRVAPESYVLVAGDQSKVPPEIWNVQMSI